MERTGLFMFRSKRVWWALALAGLSWIIPSLAMSFEVDPYEFKSLVGVVYFEFEKRSVEQNNAKVDSNRFQQTYSLDLKGNVFSRRLIIYDTGIKWTKDSFSTENSNVDTKNLFYYLRTTALPKSSIPFTLFASRLDSSSESDTSKTGTRTNSYGANWFLKFRTLPYVALFAQRDENKSSGVKTHIDTYRAQVKKNIGPTINEVNISRTLSDSTSGPATTQDVGSFNNVTNVSKSTQFSLGTTQSNSKTEDGQRTKLEGLSLSLASKPSIDFNQTHNYTMYSTKIDGEKQKGGSYNGNMDYRFSSRLTSSLGLSVNTTENDTATSTSKSDGENANLSLTYSLTKTLSLSQAVNYYSLKTSTSSASSLPGLSDRKTFREITTIRYQKQLTWARLLASYGMGYVEEKIHDKTGDSGGKGVDYQATFSLRDINVNPYVGFDVAAAYSDTQSFSGKVSSIIKTYTLDAYNRQWKKYVLLNARYYKNSQDSYVPLYDQRTESLELNAVSTYFKNTRMEATASRVHTFTEISGFSQSATESVSLTHSRQVLRGTLSVGFSYALVDSTFTGGSESITNKLYTATYFKRFSRFMNWQALAQRTERSTNTTFTNTTFIQNQVYYQLRAWALGAEHKYTVTKEPDRDLVENSIIFRATRAFYRAWY